MLWEISWHMKIWILETNMEKIPNPCMKSLDLCTVPPSDSLIENTEHVDGDRRGWIQRGEPQKCNNQVFFSLICWILLGRLHCELISVTRYLQNLKNVPHVRQYWFHAWDVTMKKKHEGLFVTLSASKGSLQAVTSVTRLTDLIRNFRIF